MSTTTPKLGLVKPDDTEVVDVAVLNANSDLIDTFALDTDNRLDAQEARNQQFQGLAANIPSTGVKDGDEYQETDGSKLLWRRIGGAWTLRENGMYLIRPSSAGGHASVAIAGKGQVTFAGAAGVSLAGVFTSAFDNYLIQVDINTSSAVNTPQLRLRAAGVDDTGTNYNMQRFWNNAASTTATQQNLSVTVVNLTAMAATRHAIKMDVYGPALAEPTQFIGQSMGANGSTSPSFGILAAEHVLSTAYDGFTLFTGSGDFTGKVTVYGYAK